MWWLLTLQYVFLTTIMLYHLISSLTLSLKDGSFFSFLFVLFIYSFLVNVVCVHILMIDSYIFVMVIFVCLPFVFCMYSFHCSPFNAYTLKSCFKNRVWTLSNLCSAKVEGTCGSVALTVLEWNSYEDIFRKEWNKDGSFFSFFSLCYLFTLFLFK